MQAREIILRDILEGTKQYIVPLFQRPYSWDKKNWEILWEDLKELYSYHSYHKDGNNPPKTHFLGAIVNLVENANPQISKFLLIDGQQRLTTLLILLVALRDIAREQNNQLGEEIHNLYLVNQYKQDLEQYKLLPTKADEEDFQSLIERGNNNVNQETRIYKAYKYFKNQLSEEGLNIQNLKEIILNFLVLVSITLDANEDPYLVFESLNYKGEPLTQADLIRNYCFMLIPQNEQDRFYRDHWFPMQESLGDKLTEFIRHFLMKDGEIINQKEVYSNFRTKVRSNNIGEYLMTLHKYSHYYKKLLDPTQEENPQIQKMLNRLNTMEVTTVYPLLLNFYNHYQDREITSDDFVALLKIIENYLIRRYVCNIPTNQLNKIFPRVYGEIRRDYKQNNDFNLLDALKQVLQTKGYPNDTKFKENFILKEFYQVNRSNEKVKLILESIEESFSHNEPVNLSNLQIEHVLPQNLTEAWKQDLGENWQEIHETYLHTIGNLTLTGYNPELSNSSFQRKKEILADSNLELNKYFTNLQNWNEQAIQGRADYLAQKALEIWSYFGSEQNATPLPARGTRPSMLTIGTENFQVETWRDVMENTVEYLANQDPKNMEILLREFPFYVGRAENFARNTRKLGNGYFINVSLSSSAIYSFCNRAMEKLGYNSEDWQLEYQN